MSVNMDERIKHYFADIPYFQIEWHKGNLRKNKNGYLERHVPEHPFAAQDGYVLEHRLTVETHFKGFLKPSTIIHHVNEFKDNNQIWNLWLTDEIEHTIIHKLGYTHKASSKAGMSKGHKKAVKNRKRDMYGRFY